MQLGQIGVRRPHLDGGTADLREIETLRFRTF
jgi:hypothetical protein